MIAVGVGVIIKYLSGYLDFTHLYFTLVPEQCQSYLRFNEVRKLDEDILSIILVQNLSPCSLLNVGRHSYN
jgi:hypothetical protein